MNLKQTAIGLKAIKSCASAANRQMDDYAIERYGEFFAELDNEQFARALKFIETCFDDGKLPSLAQIKQYAFALLSAQEDAQRCVDLICTAISTCGYTNPERAKAYIGKLGWQLVQELGGWVSICSIEGYKELEYAKISWRKSAEILHKRAAMGAIDYKPELPKPQDVAPGLHFENNQLRLVR